jgi:hypothetical protein
MTIARIRRLAALMLTAVTPVVVDAQTKVQTGGPYAPADIVSPAVVVGANVLHILVNLGPPSKQQLYYMQTAAAGATTRMEKIADTTSGAGVTYAADGLHVFVITTQGQLVHRIRGLDGKWNNWTEVARNVIARPAAATYGGQVYVFALGRGGAVVYASGTGTKFSLPRPVPGSESIAPPAAMANGKGLYVTGINPTTQLGMMATFANGAWGGWLSRYTDPANAPQGSLLVAPFDDDSQILFAAMTGPKSVMIAQLWSTDRMYSMREPVAGDIQGYPAFARHSDGNAILVARMGDNTLRYSILRAYWGDWIKWAEVK